MAFSKSKPRPGPGRPKGSKGIRARSRDLIERAIDDKTVRAILKTVVTQALSGDLTAAKLALEYRLGKPHQTQDISLEVETESAITTADVDRVLASAVRLVDSSSKAKIAKARKQAADASPK